MVVQELIAKLGFDVDQGGLNSVDNALGNFAKKLTIAAAGIYAVKKAVEATVWGISESINAAAQKEDVTTQFKVMLGDLEAAKYLYQEINQYAAVSPFETAGLADNVRQMMSFGQTAKEAFTDIKMLGDVALGDQNKLNRLALVYSQTFSAKKLTGQDLLQYVNAGFNPLEYLSRKTGKSMADLRKEMEKGKITSDMVRDSFVAATSAGGKFYKGAEEGSKTWNGMLSTLKDNIRMLEAELGEKVLPFLKDVLTAVFAMWESIAGAYRQLAAFMGVFLSDGPEAVTVAASIVASFGLIADGIMLVLSLWQTFMTVMWGVNTGVGTVAVAIIDTFKAVGQVVALIMRDIFGGVAQVGKILGIKKLENFGTSEAESAAAFANSGYYTNTTGYAKTAAGFTGESWDKMTKMWGMIGGEKAGAGPMKGSAAIDAILAKGASNQPLKVVNNNQTNNLTINADDPIKSLGDAAASKFLQSAFIEIRHATA